jgi:nucleoside-diphosphate-sugar epimerase
VKILITGNMGYVGPAVVRQLRSSHPGAVLHGFDSGFFAHCLTGRTLPEAQLDAQFFGDVRDLGADRLEGYDAIIHLAAVSNDPMGTRFAAVTKEINQDASVAIGRAAAEAGVRNFVFASSCSVYGVAEGGPRKETDPLNPVTEYARSKIGTEQALAGLNGDMTITCLRFATACGMSPRVRLDLVLNDFVACALTSGQITVLSDGTPWRPLIDTADMDLATAVAAAVPGTGVSINTEAPADSRSYQVDFGLYASLAPRHTPKVTLAQSIRELVDGMRDMGFSDPNFRDSPLIRLKTLQGHIAAGRLHENLRWTGGASAAQPERLSA